MTHSPSPHAFTDATSFMDRALEQEIGSSALFQKESSARAFQNRCYVSRSRDREQNARIYEPGDPLYKRSIWDKLRLKVFPEDKEAHAFAEKAMKDFRQANPDLTEDDAPLSCQYHGRWALQAIHDATILIEDGVEIIDHNREEDS